MCNTLANDSTKEVGGAKLYWAKEITRNGKAIIIILHCWIYNINRCNMYKNNTIERVNGIELYRNNVYLHYYIKLI